MRAGVVFDSLAPRRSERRMGINRNPTVVVLDIDQYWSLLDRAEAGDRECGPPVAPSVARHARRHNPHLAQGARLDRDRAREAFLLAKRAVRDLVRGRVGRVVYLRASEEIYFAARLHGRARGDKTMIQIRVLETVEAPGGRPLSIEDASGFMLRKGFVANMDVRPGDLRAELPPGWELRERGRYAGSYSLPRPDLPDDMVDGASLKRGFRPWDSVPARWS